MFKLTPFWEQALSHIDYAFQPIVNPYTGMMHSAEALIRGVTDAGFASIDDFFDSAYREKELYSVDVSLREIVLSKFVNIPFHDRITLFYNYDHRVLTMPNYSPGVTEQMLARFGLDFSDICFELSEKHKVDSIAHMKQALALARARGFRIALDDFGSGYAGIEVLYHTDPDYLKLDRFLVSDIDTDPKKRSCSAHMVTLAHLLGVTVIAEGIETEGEFAVCRDIGCDLVQGYFIKRPTVDLDDLHHAGFKEQADRFSERRRTDDIDLVKREMKPLPALGLDTGMAEVLTMFQENPEYTFLPVVDRAGSPLGLIHERHLKRYVYSPYGKELLVNRSLTRSLYPFMSKCPVADLSEPVEKLLEVFVNAPGAEGIILVQSLAYAGFLTSSSLLNALHDKNIAHARDLNPLTRLPGNHSINDFIRDADRGSGSYRFIYFDFDNFKPFNDRFGFRQGDRALMLFADLLVQVFNRRDCHVAHIGGDDFFVGMRMPPGISDPEPREVGIVQREFRDAATGFYSPKEVASGSYESRDREGVRRSFPLLSVSAAVVDAEEFHGRSLVEELPELFANLKRQAKMRGGGTAVVRLQTGERLTG